MEDIQIVPAIIAKDFPDFKKKVDLVKDFVDLIQLDVMDGLFVPAKTFGGLEISEIKSVNFEIHLMVQNPLQQIAKWTQVDNVLRIIFHQEATKSEEDFFACLREIKKGDKEAGVALNPETSTRKIEKFLPQLDMALLMTVVPGRSGQEFMEEVIPKIYGLRRIWPNGRIEVDGGINEESASKVVEAGADVLAVGSYFFKNPQSLKDRIKKLKNI